MSPTGKSYSFSSCVRACVRAMRCEAACARGTMLLPRLGGQSSNNPPSSARRRVGACPRLAWLAGLAGLAGLGGTMLLPRLGG